VRGALQRTKRRRVNPMRGGRQQPHQTLENCIKYKGGRKCLSPLSVVSAKYTNFIKSQYEISRVITVVVQVEAGKI
jgi:hypothetical protein